MLAGQRLRTNLAFSAFLLGAAVLAAHLFYLAFNENISSFYRARVEERWHSYECPQGKRGNIYYRDGSLLAGNQKVARVLAEPQLMPEDSRPGTCQQLSGLLGKPAEVLLETINSAGDRRGLVLAEAVPIDTALAIDRAHWKGVFTRYYYTRVYPQKDYGAATTVGYAGKEPVLRLGLESRFDEVLTGVNGKVIYRKDASGKRLPDSILALKPKRDGQSITTTIDPAVQLICEDELRKALGETAAEWGCVLVLDPRDGEVLGSSTYPTFDPNEYAKGNIGTEYNVLTQRLYEPGSTAKTILAAYALDKGWLSPTEHFRCDQLLTLNSYTIREAEAGHYIGGVAGAPIAEIIAHSSNIGMARIALGLGQDRVLAAYSNMGFFRKTGIELPAELRGFHPCQHDEKRSGKNVKWPRVTLATSGFGQGLAITPLQLAAAYCVIANGGYLVQPTLILPDSSPVELSPGQSGGNEPSLPAGETLIALATDAPEKLKGLLNVNAQAAETVVDDTPDNRVRIISQATCQTATSWLVDAVSNGTGKKAKLERCTAAGKTGTAQVPSRYGGYLSGVYTASFVGFFPAEAPRYLVLIVIGHPRGKYYGGEVAAPVFRAVGDRISYMDQLLTVEAGHASR